MPRASYWRRRPTSGLPMPRMSLIASVAWMRPTTPGSTPRTPASLHEGAKPGGGGVDLGGADPPGVVDDLALEVRLVDHVVVDEAHGADAGGGEVQARGRAQAARTDEQHLRLEQLLLPLFAHLVEHQMARVTRLL